MLISEEDGQINWPSEKGLYFRDTRIISSWTIYANGEPWQPLNGGASSYYACRIFLSLAMRSRGIESSSMTVSSASGEPLKVATILAANPRAKFAHEIRFSAMPRTRFMASFVVAAEDLAPDPENIASTTIEIKVVLSMRHVSVLCIEASASSGGL